jgi:hypothetical protein
MDHPVSSSSPACRVDTSHHITRTERQGGSSNLAWRKAWRRRSRPCRLRRRSLRAYMTSTSSLRWTSSKRSSSFVFCIFNYLYLFHMFSGRSCSSLCLLVVCFLPSCSYSSNHVPTLPIEEQFVTLHATLNTERSQGVNFLHINSQNQNTSR